MSLNARSVLVVGANRGIGLGFIRQLLELPTPPKLIIATCRNLDNAIELRYIAAQNSSVKVLKLDIESDENIEHVFEETSSFVGEAGLNLLINNAGILEKMGPEPEIEIPERGSVPDHVWSTAVTTKRFNSSYEYQTRESMQKHFNVNTTGPLILIQKFLPLLRKAASFNISKPIGCSRSGVVFISSTAASQQLTKEGKGGVMMHYKCSKTALNMMAILLARQVRDEGIFVSALHPGWVRTDMGGDKAFLSVEESTSSCIKVIGNFGEQDTGKYVSYDGTELPF